MDTPVYIFIGLLGGAVFAWLMLGRQRGSAGDTQALLLMQQQMAELSKTLEGKLSESRRDMQDATHKQFSVSQKLATDIRDLVTNLTKEQTETAAATRQMVNLAEELQSLQDILKNPKQRGVLGEYYLEALLKNILPAGGYKMQYGLGKDDDGKALIVDAVVFVKEKIIPIDSKFSLENYNRLTETRDPSERERLEKIFVNDLKNRIVETSKYIRPEDGTMDFAFMFIPHEAIYYDLLVNKVGAVADDTENLIQRAAGKYRVIIVSPTSFLAYLQTVLQGLRAMQIEENAKEIMKRVGELTKHLKAYEEYHNKLGTQLGTVMNHYEKSSKEFLKVNKDITRITGESPNLEPNLLERLKTQDE